MCVCVCVRACTRVRACVSSLQPGSPTADLGCGNGKYMRDGRHAIIGIDRSAPLAHIAAARAALSGCVCVGDATYAPMRSGIFDAALSIAVLQLSVCPSVRMYTHARTHATHTHTHTHTHTRTHTHTHTPHRP